MYFCGYQDEENEKNDAVWKSHAGSSHPIKYGDKLQLMHCKSGKYLACMRCSVADRDPECIKCTLQGGSNAAKFQLSGTFKIQRDNSPVLDGHQVQLLNCSLGDHILHTTWDDTSRSEVNLSSEMNTPFSWTLNMSSPYSSTDKEYLTAGKPIRILQSEDESFLAASFGIEPPGVNSKQLLSALNTKQLLPIVLDADESSFQVIPDFFVFSFTHTYHYYHYYTIFSQPEQISTIIKDPQT